MDTTEPAGSNQNSVKDAESTDIEVQILAAMRSRVTLLRDEADSFTMESVRRLLEEDMGLDKYALDVHKSFVKEHLVQVLQDAAGNDDASENSQETERRDDGSPMKQVAKLKAKKDVNEETGDDEKAKGSPEMGLLTAENTSKAVAGGIKDEGNKEALMSDIRKALRKRTSYIRANAEKITMALLRRLLEKDLKLEKDSLDPFKKFINKELDEVLQIPDSPKRSTEPIGKNQKKKVKSTPSKKLDSEEDSDLDAEGNEDDEEVAGKKTTTQKRKRGEGKLVSAHKKAKHTETDLENDSDAGDSETDNGHSQSSSKKAMRRTKETATPTYGKRVEHLKSVIKSCGMSIPPTIYRKAKQAPEDKREATLIKELEQVLAKEGLSSDPSEKEIKEVKKRKHISKELEGIDTTNIVSSSRRRSTASFAPPPKPKITEESESESEESENGKDNEGEEGDKEAEEGSQSEEEAEEGSQSEEESNNEDDGAEESE
ncbi:hypothetical protein AALP_AA4G090500 [Arabis alpina]|uniref:DEK-C domain-containing protein n=1 Tax=Arabis alpina TaxID=50452 RepID=A0A087H245_ARAAL|nr:hypothetical protein AALP_AA4G090500 [Arabis alpina]